MEQANEYSIVRILSQYNHNQEDYHQNVASLIQLMQEQNRSRTREVYTFEFGVSDAASALLSLFDTSRNNVVRGLSAADIVAGTTVTNYVEEETSFTCPITLELVLVGEPVMCINRCRHRFRESALRRWFENHQMCPVCRGRVV
jgi:hypothetical protein